MHKPLFALFAVALLCTIWAARNGPPSASNDQLERELKALRTTVRGLEARAMRTSSSAIAPASAAHHSNAPAEAHEPAIEDTQSPARGATAEEKEEPDQALSPSEAEHAEAEESLARSEAWFASEPADRDWAPEARGRLEAVFASQAEPGMRVDSLECRRSLCRAEVAHADEASRMGFVSDILHAPDLRWSGQVMAVRQEQANGSAATVFFFAKEGYSFSDAAEANE